jgi:hypothetical protein
MQKLEQFGVTELEAGEMAVVCGGDGIVFKPGDTGGADDLISWFVDKIRSPYTQDPAPQTY